MEIVYDISQSIQYTVRLRRPGFDSWKGLGLLSSMTHPD
jgi:hypothetical protein